MHTLCLLLLTIVPLDDTLRETVDLVEINHFYNDDGELVFDQLIFYDWSQSAARYNVREWRLIKSQQHLPHKDHATGKYVTYLQDGDESRKLIAHAFRETWLQYDTELIEREHLPKKYRQPLRTRKGKPNAIPQ